MQRRAFLKMGALLVPAATALVVAPRVAYSFIWAKPKMAGRVYRAHEFDLLVNGIPIVHSDSDFIVIDEDGNGSFSRRLPSRLQPDFGKLLITGTIKI